MSKHLANQYPVLKDRRNVENRVDVAASAEQTAALSLDRVGVPVEPRAQWPVGSAAAKGNIAPAERMLEGRALARLTDLGWGNTLRTLFDVATPDAPASPALIAACTRVLGDWGWDARPVAVVSVPSRRHPLLVDSVARGLASAGRLPYLGALTLVDGGPTGEPGGNSAYRLAGVLNAFLVGDQPAASIRDAPGPILLVDDLADSRWTLTVAARVLRRAGAESVLPFVLALRG